ncbi:MAG TPA: hypothetical protein VM617_01450, partial [Thermoanaerobaculia bacterium]|nr:hypothetical protein [Thermoanaerobaculia bacterium]
MTPPPPSPATPRRRARAPLALAVAGLALAALVALDLRQDGRRRDELAGRLEAVEIPAVAAPAVHQALRQSDPTHRELAVARAFVGAERTAAAGDEEERRATERLELARRLA